MNTVFTSVYTSNYRSPVTCELSPLAYSFSLILIRFFYRASDAAQESSDNLKICFGKQGGVDIAAMMKKFDSVLYLVWFLSQMGIKKICRWFQWVATGSFQVGGIHTSRREGKGLYFLLLLKKFYPVSRWRMRAIFVNWQGDNFTILLHYICLNADWHVSIL